MRARRPAAFFSALVCASIAAACGSASTSLTQPTGAKCAVTVDGSAASVPASGGSGTISVSTTRDCTWAATASANWIVISSATSGQGNGTVAYQIGANPDHAERRGSLSVNDQQVAISQDAAPCRYSLDSSGQSVPASGGSITIHVNADSGCAWSAVGNAGWISVAAGASGSGGGAVALTIARNPGDARTGTATIAGQTFTVSQASTIPGQDGVPCTYGIAPARQTVAAAGGAVTVSVTTTAACAWSAASQAAWITVASGATGMGSGTVTLNVASAADSRTGTVVIAGQTFTVMQSAPACSFSIAPSSQSIGADGGMASVAVTAAGGCSWTATSNANWIAIVAGANGSGSGSVGVSIAGNPGTSPRSGTATIAGQTFTVNEAGHSCTFSINPTSGSVDASGGSGTVAVTASASCAWTATANVPWIAVVSGGSGSGNGTVGYSVAPNGGGVRSGTVTIAGQTFTLTQAAAPTCAYSIAPMSQDMPAGGGMTSVSVTTSDGCSWTAVSNVAWVAVTTNASGTGPGSAGLSVAQNPAGARSGTITIAGQAFTVTQAAAPCTFTIAPRGQALPPDGGTTDVNVMTDTWCTWTATSNAPWIAIAVGATGTGAGTVRISVAPDPDGDRFGTATIAGQMFIVTQAGRP